MKKFVSLLLTVALLAAMLTVFAVPAFAETQTGTIPQTSLTWELTKNGTVLPDGDIGLTLTVGGEGGMQRFDITPTSDSRPWKDAVKAITTLIINPGVTNIGEFAFQSCTSLQSVTIPSSVTSIDNSAFDGCASLQSVTIPYGIKSIGVFAFQRCASLQSVTIPSSVTSIDDNAFHGCASLQSVTIPSSVDSIGDDTFSNCNQLESVTVKTSAPPTLGKHVFDRTSGNLAIYVPCGSVEDYKEATNWSGKSGQIKEAYIVDDQPGKNGTVMFDKDCFPKETYTEPNKTVTVTVMPAEGYRLKADSLLVTYKDENGAEKTADLTQDETDPTKYTFTMPCSNVTVKAEFEEITDESEAAPTATVFSEGNIWIIIAVAVVVLGGIAALVIVKKKKKTAQE